MKFRGNEDYFGMGDSKPTKLKVCRNFKKVSFVRDANVKMIDDFLIVKVTLYISFFLEYFDLLSSPISSFSLRDSMPS